MAKASPPYPVALHLYNDAVVAHPGFRALFWFNGSYNSGPVLEFGRALVEWFRKRHEGQLGAISVQGGGGPKFRKAADAKAWKRVDGWFSDERKGAYAGVRIEGHDDDTFNGETLPWLRLEERHGMVGAEVCGAHDAADLVAQAEELTTLAQRPGLIVGLLGLGFLLPPSKESLVEVLPAATKRYPAALELRLDDPIDGLTARSISWSDEWVDAGLEPGIPDVGWRTMLGPDFSKRLGRVPKLPGVTVSKTPFALTLTAGPAPHWGDARRGENLAPYRAVARVLEPLLMPLDIAASSYFEGNSSEDKAFMKRLRAYRSRFG